MTDHIEAAGSRIYLRRVFKVVPASQEDLQLWAHRGCKRRLMVGASAALLLSSGTLLTR